MIVSIKSTLPGFKEINFHKGFNVILSTKTKELDNKTKKLTVNATGKTTIVEILHFCLGGSIGKKSIFKEPKLNGNSFTLTLNVNGSDYELERCIDNPKKIYVTGNSRKIKWELKREKKSKRTYTTPNELNQKFAELLYGINQECDDISYYPSFRELISYNIRREEGGFNEAFEPVQSTVSHI